jgi:hypothetical protein
MIDTVVTDSYAAAGIGQTIKLLKHEFAVNINLRASNISFSPLDRQIVNQTFLSLVKVFGATCTNTERIKLANTIRATDLLMVRDFYDFF